MQTHTGNQVVTIEARHEDWVYIMIDFLKHYHPKDGNDLTVEVKESSTTWHISRALVPAADIARLLGADAADVQANDLIVLEPLDGMVTDIVPTVSYAGHA